jgi:hypothetical protein
MTVLKKSLVPPVILFGGTRLFSKEQNNEIVYYFIWIAVTEYGGNSTTVSLPISTGFDS